MNFLHKSNPEPNIDRKMKSSPKNIRASEIPANSVLYPFVLRICFPRLESSEINISHA